LTSSFSHLRVIQTAFGCLGVKYFTRNLEITEKEVTEWLGKPVRVHERRESDYRDRTLRFDGRDLATFVSCGVRFKERRWLHDQTSNWAIDFVFGGRP